MHGRSALTLVALPLVFALSACGQGVIQRDIPRNRGAGGGSSSTGPGGTGGSGPTGTGGMPSCTDPEPPGPQLLRLLTRWEYAATLADVLGVPAPNVEPIPGSG